MYRYICMYVDIYHPKIGHMNMLWCILFLFACLLGILLFDLWLGSVGFFNAISASLSTSSKTLSVFFSGLSHKNPGTCMNHWKHLCRLSLWLSSPVIEHRFFSSLTMKIRVENPLENDLITGFHVFCTENHGGFHHPQEFPTVDFPCNSGENLL